MNPALAWLPLILLAGFGLGLFFYGGLWFTVRSLGTAHHPALLVVVSFWLRTAAVIVGFYYAMDGEWQRAAVCLAGFVAARFICTRWMPQLPGGHAGHVGKGVA